MIKTSLLSTATLSILSLVSLNAEARYLSHVTCYSQTDGGVSVASASCNDDSIAGVWLTSASADLPTGELKASTYSYGQTQVNSTASIEDVINIVGLAPANSVWIDFSMNITGSVSGDIRDDFSFARADIWTSNATSTEYADVDFFYDGALVTADTSASFGNFGITINSLTDGNIDVTLSTSVLVSGADPTIYFYGNLITWPWPNSSTVSGTSDFGSTGRVSMVVPDGLSYTSESGVFLTQVVPVPPAVWLFGSGLLGLIGIARRKKA